MRACSGFGCVRGGGRLKARGAGYGSFCTRGRQPAKTNRTSSCLLRNVPFVFSARIVYLLSCLNGVQHVPFLRRRPCSSLRCTPEAIAAAQPPATINEKQNHQRTRVRGGKHSMLAGVKQRKIHLDRLLNRNGRVGRIQKFTSPTKGTGGGGGVLCSLLLACKSPDT